MLQWKILQERERASNFEYWMEEKKSNVLNDWIPLDSASNNLCVRNAHFLSEFNEFLLVQST